ncbi:hypothetical protein RB195_013696 [Necator americanus]|uniref:DUF7083 domain-containing protein n=1 Tax=Necator americanus TaxID=51031 RepID=A0ABR1DZJ4_NECAM
MLQRTTVQDISKDQYDQLSKDMQMFVSDEEVFDTFAYWYKRDGPVIRDLVLPDSKKRDLVLMKLDEDAYRKYADDMLPKQSHEIDFETKTLTELDYTALKTLQFVAGLQDPSLREVRLRMLRRLDTHKEDAPLTIEDLVAECENFTALKMDNTDMEGCPFRVEKECKVQLWRTALQKYMSASLLQHWTEDATEAKKTIRPSQEKPDKIQGNGTCYVTESTNLLGLEWCIQLPAYKELKDKYHCRIATKEEANREEIIADLKKQYAEVFKCGLGRYVKTKAKLLLRDDAVPVFKKKRPVPFAPNLDAEIDRLVAEQVIFPVEHSEWATPIVVVKKKSGQICLCGDFSTGLNDVLQLHQHPLPTAEDVFTKLNGGQLFGQIDFAEAYLQVEVEEESKEIIRTEDCIATIVYPSA